MSVQRETIMSSLFVNSVGAVNDSAKFADFENVDAESNTSSEDNFAGFGVVSKGGVNHFSGFGAGGIPFAFDVCPPSSGILFPEDYLKAANITLLAGNDSGEGSENTFTSLRVVLDVYVVICLCLVGFVGNALAVAVLRRDQLNTTSWLLQTLAVVDTAYLVACLFIQTLKTINDSTDWLPTLQSYLPRLEPYLWPIASMAQTVTVWTVLLLTVDRYIAVCSPFDPGLRSLKRARIAVAVVVVASVAYNVPLLFEREAIEEADICTGVKRWRTRKTAEFSDLFAVVYKTVSYFVFRAVGPLVALLVLNARLIIALNRSRRRRRQMLSSAAAVASGNSSSAGGFPRHQQAENAAVVTVTSSIATGEVGRTSVTSTAPGHVVQTPAPAPAKRQRRPGGGSVGGHRENITLMLVVVVSVFIVCQLPDLGLRIAGTQMKVDYPVRPRENDYYRLINSITNVMLTLNSSINFLIYCLVGKKFRRIFVRMVCKQSTPVIDDERRGHVPRQRAFCCCHCGNGDVSRRQQGARAPCHTGRMGASERTTGNRLTSTALADPLTLATEACSGVVVDRSNFRPTVSLILEDEIMTTRPMPLNMMTLSTMTGVELLSASSDNDGVTSVKSDDGGKENATDDAVALSTTAC